MSGKKIYLILTAMLLAGCSPKNSSQDRDTGFSERLPEQVASLQNLQDGTFLAMHKKDDGGLFVAIMSPLDPKTVTEANWSIERNNELVTFRSIPFPRFCAGFEESTAPGISSPEVVECQNMTRTFTIRPLANGAVIFTTEVNGKTLCLGAPRPPVIDSLVPELSDCINDNQGPGGTVYPKYQWVITSPQSASAEVTPTR